MNAGDANIGSEIDNYRIVQVIGKGGMGVVYKAHDMTLDRDVALKMISPDHSGDSVFLRRFRSEAKSLAQIQNANIVSLYAFRETAQGFCIIMEYVEGETLGSVLKKQGPLPLPRVLNIFRQILTALNDAHQAGVIHRDIKPGNIMLKRNDVVKITDFGLAKMNSDERVTSTGSIAGTPGYTSPEQLRGEKLDGRTDLWSVGVMMYEALSGHLPFRGEHPMALGYCILNEPPLPIASFTSSVPPAIESILLRSMEKDRDGRFQNAAHFVGMLDKYQTDVSKPTRRMEPEPFRSPYERGKGIRPTPFLYLFSLLLLSILIYYLYRLFFPAPPEPSQLYVYSVPSGAGVLINGKLAGNTPIRGRKIDAGTYSLQLQLRGFKSKDSIITVAEPGEVSLSFGLAKNDVVPDIVVPPAPRPSIPPKGWLVLRSIPASDMYVDGVLRAKNTAQSRKLTVAEGGHKIVFKSPRYGDHGVEEVPVTIGAKQTSEITCYFESYVNIGVRGESAWGTVMIDGNPIGQDAPIAHYPVSAGKHRVMVTRRGYDTVEGAMTIDIVPTLTERIVPLVFTLRKQ